MRGAASWCALAALIFALLNTASHRLVSHPPLAERGFVLITGASSGIGRSAVLSLAARHPGWQLLAGVRRESDVAALAALKLPNVRGLLLDVADGASRAAAAAEVARLAQSEDLPLLALVNNAGISRGAPVEHHDLADARAVFETNVFGALGLTQLLLPALRAARGRIVMVSSVAGFLSMPMTGVYAASKFALEALSDALRRELRGEVAVCIVQPAYVKSAIFGSASAASHALSGADAARASYPHLFTPAREAARTREIAGAAPTEATTDLAIEAALSDARPLARAQVASAGGMHASLLRWIAWALPERLVDSLDGSG